MSMRSNLNSLFIFLVLALIGSTEYVSSMFSILLSLVFSLIVIVVPLLLIYAFIKSTLDALKVRVTKRPMKLLAPLTAIGLTMNDIMASMMSLIYVLIPFLLVLLVWKAFIKLIKI